MGGGGSKVFFAWRVLAPMKTTAGRGLLSTPLPPLPPPRFASTIGGTCAFFSRRHCPRPPPSPLLTPLKPCGPPPPGLPYLFHFPVILECDSHRHDGPGQCCTEAQWAKPFVSLSPLPCKAQLNYPLRATVAARHTCHAPGGERIEPGN
jgi:hypothetical protein